jgi:DNA-binding HxlR family transcriptional regulator
MNNLSLKNKEIIDEEEIFKSLSHRIRRDIIKIIGVKSSKFSEIQNHLNEIDSPTLSYHLKNLQPLLVQEENEYKLSEIGESAFRLLSKTDQTVRISRYKRRFLYAYYLTVICWITAMTVIPFIIHAQLEVSLTTLLIQIIIIIISTTNYMIVWRLRKKF